MNEFEVFDRLLGWNVKKVIMEIVDVGFFTVTWHHQSRPFVHVLACKTTKTSRGLTGKASSVPLSGTVL